MIINIRSAWLIYKSVSLNPYCPLCYLVFFWVVVMGVGVGVGWGVYNLTYARCFIFIKKRARFPIETCHRFTHRDLLPIMGILIIVWDITHINAGKQWNPWRYLKELRWNEPARVLSMVFYTHEIKLAIWIPGPLCILFSFKWTN